MANDLTGVYYAKNTANGTYTDITSLYDGVRILQMEGFNAKGKPVNIYNAQWLDSQEEDFMITTENSGNPVVIRENVDIKITFVVKQKYATNTIDVMTQHDAFVGYMTNSDVWIKSAYVGNKEVHCVCLEKYEPTTMKLQRGTDSWAMGTITLHTLDAPTIVPAPSQTPTAAQT